MSFLVKIDDYLSSRKESAIGENQQRWQILEELYSKKLWHPLTLKLREYIGLEEFTKNENLLEVYKSFIHEFEHRVNPLYLVEIVLPIAKTINDPKEACKFLENIKNTVKNDKEAVILCLAGIAEQKLLAKDSQGRCLEINDVRALLEDAEAKLDALSGVTRVHGEFHRVNSTYLQEIGDFGGYYKEALRYLGCVDLKEMQTEDRRILAFCLSLAALLGEHVYNFGELLAHPILESLKDVKEGWIVDLLYAFNSGDLQVFEEMRPKWSEWDDLKKNSIFLERKIRLLCLMEMSFARAAKKRQISFDEIGARAQIPPEEVEFLVMKALSRGLVKGNVNQVEQTVAITWVQPRVLDRKQVKIMANRISDWCNDVNSMESLLENEAQEILTK